MPFIPPEQLARAREMDLLTYLRCCEPDELVSVGGNTYATKSHDSLKISNGEWYWWSRGVGGSSALDYLTTVRKLSLPDAVQRILSAGGVPLAEPPRRKARPTKSFSLPPRHADNRRVFSYLRGRGIDPEIINHCIKHGLLYAKMKPAKQEQFEQRYHAELALYDAAVRYLENLKSEGEAITPKKWRSEADVLAAQKNLQYQELRAMREEIKAVEKLRKTAEQLEKDAQPKEKKRNDPER